MLYTCAHETCLALESIKESSAAVRKPRCVRLVARDQRVLVVQNLKEACRLPVRVQTLVFSIKTHPSLCRNSRRSSSQWMRPEVLAMAGR